MPFTNFPNGITSFGVPVFGGGVLPTFGNVFYLVAAKASTDPYYNVMADVIADDTIFATLKAAYDAMTTNQGDTLVIMPGNHVQTASLTWAKDQTRIIGWAGPNQAYQPGTLTTGGVRLSCVTTGISEILKVTGNYVSMYNLGTYNSFDAATNYCDIRVVGRNFYGYGLSMRGGNGATQLATIGAGVPIIFDATATGGANAAFLERCTIGSSGNNARTYGPGCVQFLGPGANAGFGIHFKDCVFSTRIEAATANTVGLVHLYGNGCVDREVLFDGCAFYNFVINLGTGPTYVFRDACATTHQIVLKNSIMNKGFTSWTDAATYLSSSCPTGTVAGGLGVNS
jgi:hypothetical protein